jgi:hypothetical protein
MTERWIEKQPAWKKMKIILFDKRATRFGSMGKCRHEKCRGKIVRAGKSGEFIL